MACSLRKQLAVRNGFSRGVKPWRPLARNLARPHEPRGGTGPSDCIASVIPVVKSKGQEGSSARKRAGILERSKALKGESHERPRSEMIGEA